MTFFGGRTSVALASDYRIFDFNPERRKFLTPL
jgi:hypothetical protein